MRLRPAIDARRPTLARLRRVTLRPAVESLEDRTVLSVAVAPHVPHEAALVAAPAPTPSPAHHRVAPEAAAVAHPHRQAKALHAEAATKKAAHKAKTPAAHTARTTHHKTKKGAASTGTTPGTGTSTTPTSTAPPAPTATSTAPTSTSTAPTSTAPTSTAPTSTPSATDPTVLQVQLNPIDLNLLGLEVKLYGQDVNSPVTVTVSAQSGSGQLLGNLLSDVSNLVNLQGVNSALNNVLGNVITLVDQSALQVNGVTGATGSPTSTTPVLDAFVAPVHLDLLGAVVDTSPIHLQILAHAGSGLVLGNILTDVANLLNTPPKNGKLTIKYVEQQLGTLLNELNAQLPNIPSAPTTPVTPPAGTDRILSLVLPPINLNLLGLVLQTSTIQVNADAQSGNGQLLGNLLVDVLNTLDASQSDLDQINSELNGVLAKVVGVLNATTLTLPTGAVQGLSAPLQQLASPTLINTSGNTVPPEQVLNLIVASNTSSAPPVDVNLLGVVVTTSNIQAQLLAEPGDGQVLGNLVYNVSHLLDPGGLLSVLTLLNSLSL